MQDIRFDRGPHRKNNTGIRYLAGEPVYSISLGFLFFGDYVDA